MHSSAVGDASGSGAGGPATRSLAGRPRLGGSAKCFGFVQTHDTKPKRRLFELLAAPGMQANQQVTFRTDGADDVRDLPLYLNPPAEHLLDWFHVTMRLTVLTQLAKGLRAPPPAASADSVAAQLARLKTPNGSKPSSRSWLQSWPKRC